MSPLCADGSVKMHKDDVIINYHYISGYDKNESNYNLTITYHYSWHNIHDIQNIVYTHDK